MSSGGTSFHCAKSLTISTAASAHRTHIFAQYNLAEGRYLMDSHSAGTGKDIRWETEVKDNPRLRDSFYSADNLRAISDR